MSKFYISYFYEIRFFPQNLVPVSTALWDPKWYHNFQHQNTIFRDKRGIINGVRCPGLSPTFQHLDCVDNETSLCNGKEKCKTSPEDCEFLKRYYKYLQSLDFNETIKLIENSVHRLAPDADICLVVYEAPGNPCSEREPLKKWFEENGVKLLEFGTTERDCYGY